MAFDPSTAQPEIPKASQPSVLDQFDSSSAKPEKRRFLEGIVTDEPARAALESFVAVPGALANGITLGQFKKILENRTDMAFPEVQLDSIEFDKNGNPQPSSKGKNVVNAAEFAGSSVTVGNLLKLAGAGAKAGAQIAGKGFRKAFPAAHQLSETIRPKLYTYFADQVTKYGDDLEAALGKISGKPIDLQTPLIKMQATLQKQGILDDTFNLVKGKRLNKVEKQMIESYNKMSKLGDKMDAKDYAQEILKVKRSAGKFVKNRTGKNNELKRLATNTAKEMSEEVESFATDLKAINKNYAKFRDVFDSANSKFEVFGSKFSDKGEFAIKNYRKLGQGGRDLFKSLENVLDFKFVERTKQISNAHTLLNSGPIGPVGRGATSLADMTVGQPVRAGGRLLDQLIQAQPDPTTTNLLGKFLK